MTKKTEFQGQKQGSIRQSCIEWVQPKLSWIRKNTQFRERKGVRSFRGGWKDVRLETNLSSVDGQWYQGRKKLGSETEGGSIGQIPKDWVQRTTLIELDQEKKSVQGTEWEGGSIPKTTFRDGRRFDQKDS